MLCKSIYPNLFLLLFHNRVAHIMQLHRIYILHTLNSLSLTAAQIADPLEISTNPVSIPPQNPLVTKAVFRMISARIRRLAAPATVSIHAWMHRPVRAQLSVWHSNIVPSAAVHRAPKEIPSPTAINHVSSSILHSFFTCLSNFPALSAPAAQITAGCTHDSECTPTTACINQRCQDPCAEANPCAGNAECRVQNSRPICFCPAGWGGDPQVQCYKRKC